MADKKKKDKKKSRPDQVRDAVAGTFEATAAGTRDRVTELVEEITTAVQRVRQQLDDLNVVDDLKGLRTQVEQLAERVGALESSSTPPRKASAGTAAKRAASPQSKFGTSSTTRKAAAARKTATARKTTGAKAKPASTRSTGTRRATTPAQKGSTGRS